LLAAGDGLAHWAGDAHGEIESGAESGTVAGVATVEEVTVSAPVAEPPALG